MEGAGEGEKPDPMETMMRKIVHGVVDGSEVVRLDTEQPWATLAPTNGH